MVYALVCKLQVHNESHQEVSGLSLVSIKQRIKCLAEGHNKGPPENLKPATPQSQIQHSTTESLCLSLNVFYVYICL